MSSGPRTTRSRRTAALLLSGTTLAAAAVTGLAGQATASSHREAPLISADPLGDNTDTYMFVSPDDPSSVTLIANWIGLQEPNGGPTFYPWGTGDQGYYYDVKIDNDGDAISDLTYRWTFSTQDTRNAGTPDDFADDTFLYANGVVNSLDDENLLFKQTYDITVSTDDGATFPTTIIDDADVAPSNIGPGSMPNYDAELFAPAITTIDAPGLPADGGKSYAGQADDPFFLDLRVFDLLYGGDLTEVGEDTLAGYNVNTVALQLPKTALALNGTPDTNPVIGMWSTTERQSVTLSAGGQAVVEGAPEVQVSRLGQPLVNEVVIPATLKDAFNAGEPVDDASVAPIVNKVLDPEVPKLIEAIYGAPAPAGPRTDLAEIFLTGVTTALDGTGFYTSLGSAEDAAPIPLDLNSQALNADYVDGTFRPSEMLRLNMALNGPTSLNEDGTPGDALPAASPLGVAGGDIQGFPNGRRLADDVVDIALVTVGGFFLGDDQSAQAGVLAGAGGDKVGVNDREFSESFPYIASPNNESVNQATGGVVEVPVDNGDDGGAQPTTPAPAANGSGVRTPVGGVETGAGAGSGSSALPLVSGAVALVLLGAGGASLVQGRRRKVTPTE